MYKLKTDSKQTPNAMSDHAEAASKLMKALANEKRLMILCSLVEGELSVGALNQRIDLSQSALSQHLAKLRDDGMVSTRRESQTIYYSLASNRILQIIELLHEMYCR